MADLICPSCMRFMSTKVSRVNISGALSTNRWCVGHNRMMFSYESGPLLGISS